MKPSKKQNINVNVTKPNKIIQHNKYSPQKILLANASQKINNVSVPKQLVALPNRSQVTIVPVTKSQNVIQKQSVTNSLPVSKISTYTSQQYSKQFQTLNSVTTPNFHDKKSVINFQKSIKNNGIITSNAVSHSKYVAPKVISSPPCISNVRPKNSVPNGAKSEINKNKTNLPVSVLSSLQKNGISVSSLQKNGISVTNVEDDSKKDSVNPCHQLGSLSYFNNVKHSLQKSNTNIKLVSESKSVSHVPNDYVKSNSLCQASIKLGKRKITHSDAVYPNKSLCIKKSDTPSQNISCHSKNNLHLKVVPAGKVIGKTPSVTKVCDKSAKLIHITPQFQSTYDVKEKKKDNPNFISPVTSHSKIDSSTLKLLPSTPSSTIKSKPLTLSSTIKSLSITSSSTMKSLPLISKRDLTIVPVKCSNNRSHKENSLKNIPQPSSQQKPLSSLQTSTNKGSYSISCKNGSSTSNVAPFLNSSLSVTVINSAIKPQSSKNASVLNLPTPVVEKKSSQHNASNKSLFSKEVSQPKTTSRNIDVTNDREALLSVLALCESDDYKPSDKKSKVHCDINPRVISIDLENKTSVSQLNNKSDVKETIKLKDVSHKTAKWPKPVVILERIEAFEKYMEEEKKLTNTFELSKSECKFITKNGTTDNKQISENIVSVNSDCINSSDNQLQNTHMYENMVINSHSAVLKSIDNTVVFSKNNQDNSNVNETINSKTNQKEITFSEEVCMDSVANNDMSNNSTLSFSKDSNYSLNINLCTRRYSDSNKISQNDSNIKMCNVSQKSEEITGKNAVYVQNKNISGNLIDIRNKNIHLESIENHVIVSSDRPYNDIDIVKSTDEITKDIRASSSHDTSAENSALPEKYAKNLLKSSINDFSVADKRTHFLTDSRSIYELAPIKKLLSDIILTVENELSENTFLKTCNKMIKDSTSVTDENLCATLTENYSFKISETRQRLMKASNKASSNISSKNVCNKMSEKQISSCRNSDLIPVSEYSDGVSRNSDTKGSQYINSAVDGIFNNFFCKDVHQESRKTENVTTANKISPNIEIQFSCPSETPSEKVNREALLDSFNEKDKIDDIVSVSDNTLVLFPNFSKVDNNNSNFFVDQSDISVCLSEMLSQVEYILKNSNKKQHNLSDEFGDTTEISPLQCDKVKLSFSTEDKIDSSSGIDYHSLTPRTCKDKASSSNLLIGNLDSVSETLNSKNICTKNKQPNQNVIKSSEFMQNSLLSDEQEVSVEMVYDCLTEKSSISCEKLPYFGEEYSVNMKDKCSYESNEDEQKDVFNQVLSDQVTTSVTSPKLSLKRKQSELSPNRKHIEETTNGLSIEKCMKRIKLDQPVEATQCIENLLQNSTCPTAVSSNGIFEANNRKKFMELLEYAKTLMEKTSETEKMKIENRMLQNLNFAQQSYVNSEEFNSLLLTSSRKMIDDSSNTFLILVDIKKELKKHSDFKKKSKSKEIIKESKEYSKASCSSFSFRSNNIDGNEHNFSSNVTNDLHQPVNHSITFEVTDDSVSRDNFVEEKNSDSQSVDSLFSLHSIIPKSKKSIISNNRVENISKTLKPGCALNPKSDVFNNNSTDASIRDIKINPMKSSCFNDISIENKFGSSEIASALGLYPSTSKTSKDSVFKNCNAEEKFDIPTIASASGPHISTSETSKQTVLQSDNAFKRHDSFFAASTSQLHSSTEIFKRNSFKNENAIKKCDSKLMAPSSLPTHSSSSDEKKDTRHVIIQNDRNAARIKKLEKALADLDKAIKKCQKRELSLDDLDKEDSVYIKENQYKKRFIVIWKKLCELKKTSSRTGRIVEKRFKYEGSRYKAINEAIQKLVDKKKVHEKFPDYSEVLKILKRVNEERVMGLSESDILEKAKEVFEDVIGELRIRRWRDDAELFGCYLTDNIDQVEDPAEHDEDLKSTLDESNKNFEKSINEVIDKYAEMQKYAPADLKEGNEENVSDNEDNAEKGDEEDEEEQEKGEKANDVNDMEEELPLTAPASPALTDENPAVDKMKISDDDIEIINDSDRSTDPNDDLKEEISIKKMDSGKKFDNQFSKSESAVATINIADSNSSDDLPSIQDLLSADDKI